MHASISKPSMIILTILSISLAACSSIILKTPEATLAPIKLKIMVLPYLSYAPFYIAQEEGFFAEQGLEVEFIRMDDTSESIAALIQGGLDVSSGTIEIGTLNAISKGANIKFVADKGYLDPDQCDYIAWIARKDLIDSGKLDDLKNVTGMKIDFSTTSTDEYFLETILKEANLTSSDVEQVELNPPNRLESLRNAGIDIGFFGEPWTSRAISSGGVVWKSPKQVTPNFPFSLIFFGPSLVEKNPEAGKRFMVAYMKSVKQYNQGKTDRNLEIIAKATELDPEEIKGMCWQPIKADGSVDLNRLMEFQDWALEKGYLDSKLTQDQIWDGQFIEYAQKAISQ
jgi:NitT/TauT family transport system substrate-binding protein